MLTNRAYFGIIALYMNFYGGTPSVNNSANTQNKRPGRASLVIAAVFSTAFSALASDFLVRGSIFTAAIDFLISAALLSFLLVFFHNPLALAPPIVGGIIAHALCHGGSVIFPVSLGIVFFAVLYALCHIRLISSFRQFFVTAGAFSLVGAVMLCIILYKVYGELGGGIVALGERLASAAPQLAAVASQSGGIDYSSALSAFESLLSSVCLYIPAIIASLGIICAWLMRAFFELFTRISGISSLFVGRFEVAPRALAVIYLICSFGGAVFAVFSDGALFAVSNVTLILSLIFFAEGARFMLASAVVNIKDRTRRARVLMLVLAVLFFTAALFVILPYYGAFRILFSRRREAK